MAPIFEDGNNKKDRPREGDLFETRSPGTGDGANAQLSRRRVSY